EERRRAGHPATRNAKEGDMRAKCLTVAATVVALTFGTAQTALADNNSSGSVGAVQIGNVSVTPSAGTSQSGTSASVSAPTSISGTGNNTATNSVGSMQAARRNTASGSTGSMQSSRISTLPYGTAGVAIMSETEYA